MLEPVFCSPFTTSPFEQLAEFNQSPYWIITRLNNVSPDVAIETALPGELPYLQPQVTEFFVGLVDTSLNCTQLFDEFITEPQDQVDVDYTDMFQSVLVQHSPISPSLKSVPARKLNMKKTRNKLERMDNSFKCPFCDLRLRNASSMKKHFKRHGINSKIDKDVILYEDK
ncbi:hypothetical protein HDV06_004045 [Boothiomyces sp. JEL0866]|nr:hypothetical protein HDV06_004045 [Boothiomyces sp. JEL0866]